MSVKICIIGAGSCSFSVNLVKDVCLNSNFKDCTVTLVDINETRLNAIYGLCVRYKEELGASINIEKSMDRRSAMKGADFVMNVALDGGHERFKQGIDTAYKNGYRFGGSLHIVHDEGFYINFHQLSLMEEILKDTLEICPNAYYVLVANPVQAGVTYLKRKYKNAKVIGMCHGFNGAYKVAQAMGLDKEDVSFEIAGVNHFIWMTEFKYRGEDAYPLLDKWIDEHGGLLVDNEEDLKKFGLAGDEVNRKAVDLYHRFGLFPIGDTPSSGGGAWGWEYHTDAETEEFYQCKPYEWYGIMFKGNAGFTKELEYTVANKSVKVSDVFPPHASPEPMIPLMEGLAFDTNTRVVVNILNDGGYMKGLPTDYEVEIAANIDKDGVHPICNEGLPKPIMAHLLRDRVAPVELELSAFENHSRDLLVDLVMTDPWTKARAQAEKLVRDILDLPINARMKEYYR